MSDTIRSVNVLGLGKIGLLVAELLQTTGFTVTGVDRQPPATSPVDTVALDIQDQEALAQQLRRHDAVVSCLPYHCNLQLATLAHAARIHYFDLTEDVATTRGILALAKDTQTVLAPQCGLAPGFIAIVGAALADRFERVRSIKLRVGALPQHPTGLLGYAFNWSPEGVVNEYLNDCEVIENGEQKWVSPLEWLEQLVINGIQLEAFTTSGGLGTMCRSFSDRVENLDYKSIRYPGHAQQMNFFFHELLMRERRELAGEILTNAKPAVSDDVVYIHASAEGWKDRQLLREEFVRQYYPQKINGRPRRAIAWTTAASVAAVVELVASGRLPDHGFIRQETIALQDFLNTVNGRRYTAAESDCP
ncbi:MAG: saccharopine dehydrogenase C-terminal domain-containing protein [Desulfopila sp.]